METPKHLSNEDLQLDTHKKDPLLYGNARGGGMTQHKCKCKKTDWEMLTEDPVRECYDKWRHLPISKQFEGDCHHKSFYQDVWEAIKKHVEKEGYGEEMS